MQTAQIFIYNLLKFISKLFHTLYQDILNILNYNPIKDITKNKINAFIEFKVYFKYLYIPSALGLGNTSSSDS